MTPRRFIDIDTYLNRIQHTPCFICELVAGNPDYQHHIIYQDETAIAFLNPRNPDDDSASRGLKPSTKGKGIAPEGFEQ